MTLQEALYDIKTKYITNPSSVLDILCNEVHKVVPEWSIKSRFDWQAYVRDVCASEGWDTQRKAQVEAQKIQAAGVPQGVRTQVKQVELKDNPLEPPTPKSMSATQEELSIKLDKAIIKTGFPKIDELFRIWLKVRALTVASMMNNILEAQRELQGYVLKATCSSCGLVIRVGALTLQPGEVRACTCGKTQLVLDKGNKLSWTERSKILSILERCQKQIEAAVGYRFDGGRVELA
jgi:hypothetical protein